MPCNYRAVKATRAADNRSSSAPLARAGVAAGVDGVFMEVHDRPERALSDGSNALALRRFKRLARNLRDLGKFVRNLETDSAKGWALGLGFAISPWRIMTRAKNWPCR